MSLLELLRDEYSRQTNYQDKRFISYKAARRIVTRERIDEWSKSHPLCLEHGNSCPQRRDLINEISRGRNIFLFIVLVFAEHELLTKKFMVFGFSDVMLFDTKELERVSNAVGLSTEQKQVINKCRSYVGVIFATRRTQEVPGDAVLPYLKRESLDRYGSYGVLYRVTIPGRHIRQYNDTELVAEKRIRPMTNPSDGDWRRLFREVETLQKRKDHPNIISLLASYTLDTVESGHHVKTLHLLFPWAEMDLADWMTSPRVPFNVTNRSIEERRAYIFRSIYALVSSIAYLHREIDGEISAHHDLKPRNILVVNDVLKIADFGHSHLRPILEESATEGDSGLGTYEYQPPEYWTQDGVRAEIKHGRAFDVWSMGCIIIELATLVVYGWQSEMVTKFRNERRQNRKRDRKSPVSIQEGTDVSFHNNMGIVQDWIRQLKTYRGSPQLNEVLNIVAAMLAQFPSDRTYMWEVQMDLYKALKPYDKDIPDLEGDLCTRPPFRGGPRPNFDPVSSVVGEQFSSRTETPLHRAAKRNDRTRTIRLWELGWPLSLPDKNDETPLSIMKKSTYIELKSLENDVLLMLDAARTGNVEEIRKLFSKGLSPLMVDVSGSSALYEAIMSSQIDVIDCLLENKAKEQSLLWHPRLGFPELPLHTAARMGLKSVIEQILDFYPNINVSADGLRTALYLAVRNGHSDVVKYLLAKKAQVWPESLQHGPSETLLHAAVGKDCEIMKLLLEADDVHKCIEWKDGWTLTPLLQAAKFGDVKAFEILLQHGASVHAVGESHRNLLDLIVTYEQLDLLKQCIKYISLKDFNNWSNALKIAKEQKNKEMVRFLTSHIRQAGGSGGRNSDPLSLVRKGLEKLKNL